MTDEKIVLSELMSMICRRAAVSWYGERESALGQGEKRLQIVLHPGDRLADAPHDRREVDVRELVYLVEDQRHEQRTQRSQDDPDHHEGRQRGQPAGNLPALEVKPRKKLHERIAHDGQHGRNEDVDDDRGKYQTRKRTAAATAAPAMNRRKVWGVALMQRDSFSRLLRQPGDRGLRTHRGIADLDQQFAVLGDEHVDARAELDEAADAVLLDLAPARSYRR